MTSLIMMPLYLRLTVAIGVIPPYSFYVRDWTFFAKNSTDASMLLRKPAMVSPMWDSAVGT